MAEKPDPKPGQLAGNSPRDGNEIWPELIRRIRDRTPARILSGRAGAAYRTATQMELREAHAAARDAVEAELDLNRDLGRDFIERWKLFEVSTHATSKQEYLLRPDLGRGLSNSARELVRSRCQSGKQFQIIVGDGLSVTAVSAQVPGLLPRVQEGARERGWTVGQPFVVRHCRVGILNVVGEILSPEVAVLLIGERPGLATAESLSAYLAYRPRHDHTDADRNLISNLHSRGIGPEEAARRILDLAAQMMQKQISGFQLKEQLAISS
ncbi:MAG TPA: ethanolamine ammonia-lyase subunit EutC [Terriglobales bacterium]|nr:ethanolamine ammonia-lyase subunit EutC [Terriglobales bacterium]